MEMQPVASAIGSPEMQPVASAIGSSSSFSFGRAWSYDLRETLDRELAKSMRQAK